MAGAGRKAITQRDPQLLSALLALVEPDERGDPISPLQWTTKSLRRLTNELTQQGHAGFGSHCGQAAGRERVSLQANAKTLEGEQHTDRDAQFRYINEQVRDHQAAGEPVVSVDTKKKGTARQAPQRRPRLAAPRRLG